MGYADNGDFGKIMGLVGLKHPTTSYEDTYFLYINSKFLFAEPGWYASDYLSSETLVARAARAIGWLTSRDGLFDIRVLGVLHLALLLFALAMILSATRRLHLLSRCLLALFLIIVFTDMAYVSLFNSFYSQTASFLFLLVTAGFAALLASGGGNRPLLLLGLLVAAAMFVSSKPQELIQAPLLALVVFRAALAVGARFRKVRAVALTLLFLAFSGWCYLNGSTFLRQTAIYNAVFYELLPDSPDGRADLEALGVSGELVKYSGTHAFMPEIPWTSPWFQEAFFKRVTHLGLMQFYLARPKRFWALFKKAAVQAPVMMTPGYGGFEKSTGLPPRTMSKHFRLWSNLMLRAFPSSPGALLAWLLVAPVAALILRLRKGLSPNERLGVESFGLLSLMPFGALFICLVADSVADYARHLYAFHAMADLCLIISGVWLIEAGVRAIKNRGKKEKEGITLQSLAATGSTVA